ncbi:MAG: efflux RND transporter periplasmic adaptor subunit, partial [Prevotella sp.]|nr:efflux RND transporter periplasmic adaptor subunit [Prevotella sp.]
MKYNNSKTIISILVLMMLITSCTKQKIKVEDKKTEDPISNTVRLTDQQIKTSEIQIGSIETRLISNTLKINGEIAAMPQNTASVSMPMGGRIRSINVIPGSKVNKGQILAYIENYDFIELQQNYLETKSKKYYVGLDYQRQRMLYSND